MEDPICYELRVISIATGTSVKCYSPKSFPSFKASLELSFSRIMHAHMLQRLFETSVQPNTCNFFLGLLIRRICRLLSTRGIWLVGLARYLRSTASKDELLLRIQAIGILFHKQFQNLFHSIPRRIAALIQTSGYICFTHVKFAMDISDGPPNFQPWLGNEDDTSTVASHFRNFPTTSIAVTELEQRNWVELALWDPTFSI
ncbi:uncharacterized protein TNCV_1957051 [Trichonephila clavipes]|nr:uncharacterized protein TNCV_1957051 [Trichonephila clavipes]